jgi:hypothetical protein
VSHEITAKISLTGIQNALGVASEMLLDQLLKMLNEKYINMYLLKIERYSRT